MNTVHEAGPAGLGGWLILLVLSQFVAIARVLKGLIGEIDFIERAPEAMRIAIYPEVAIVVASLVLSVVVTITMLRKQRPFVGLWKAQAIAFVVLPIAADVLVARIANIPMDRVFTVRTIGPQLVTIVPLGLWWWYLNVSVRVKNTFIN
jgi:Protein of unknown function (DUF2569)